MFCVIHRYADNHECNFDYRTAARDSISKGESCR
ncbi:unnamed protein product [Spirodela intermedia]|uniref:Uncharacterized protein n=2 Tax=Spirodela intermedia TaxID=51605 RepID=A0A7I8LIA5_SPIIN|nr:unnamed protein product [Spirodela intermedia]CAA6672338.1 unnamed protein product [Spirodela intermedia]CAA7409520.1 unnamed protein product [Spirodela intermedia]